VSGPSEAKATALGSCEDPEVSAIAPTGGGSASGLLVDTILTRSSVLVTELAWVFATTSGSSSPTGVEEER
jgi:hypothetical protein